MSDWSTIQWGKSDGLESDDKAVWALKNSVQKLESSFISPYPVSIWQLVLGRNKRILHNKPRLWQKKNNPVSQTVKPSHITDLSSQPHWNRTVVKPDLQVTIFFSKRKRDTATSVICTAVASVQQQYWWPERKWNADVAKFWGCRNKLNCCLQKPKSKSTDIFFLTCICISSPISWFKS